MMDTTSSLLGMTLPSQSYNLNRNAALREKYYAIWDRKYKDKGQSIWVFQLRTLSIAFATIDFIDSEKRKDAVTFMRVLQQRAGRGKDVICALNSQLELAMANQENFIYGLHRFYQELSKKIKKEKLYSDYYSALAYLQDCVQRKSIACKHPPLFLAFHENIVMAEINLLMQGAEYLKKDYDVLHLVAGITSNNDPIIIRDPYPLIEVPLRQSMALIFGHPYNKSDRSISPKNYQKAMVSYFRRYGYSNISNLADIEILYGESNLYGNTVLSMATVINEYLVDMLPDKPFVVLPNDIESWVPKLDTTCFSVEKLKAVLHQRRRSLANNGAVVKLDCAQVFQEIKLKETCRNDEIVCVYKIKTIHGDICGYYNTNTELFYSCAEDSNWKALHTYVMGLVLWVYAAFVCDVSGIETTNDSFHSSFFTHDGTPTNARFYMLGGKPRNYLDKDSDNDKAYGLFNKSRYSETTDNINGSIRKLTFGQKQNDESIHLAKKYGIDLHKDEFYVAPIIQRKWSDEDE